MVETLVARLLARGVCLSEEDGRLVCRAPAGVLTGELRDEVGRNKEALLALIREANRDARSASPIPRIGGPGPWVLSTAQERFWLMEKLSADAGVYNIPGAFRLEGPLVPNVLEEALRAFVARHTILNVRFASEDGAMHPTSSSDRPFHLERVYLLALPKDAREAALVELLETWAVEPLSLDEGDTFRARLVALGPDEHALFVMSHAAIWDGWSFDVMLGELAALYPRLMAAATNGTLADLPVQYTDYAAWQRDRLADGSLAANLEYWRARLAPPVTLVSLPTDRPRPAGTFDGARLNFLLDEALVEQLRRLARSGEGTLFMVLFAGFVALLHRYTRQNDVVVLTPVRGRDRPELEALVGCFANMMPLRLRPDPEWTFHELLMHVREHCLDGYANADAPFEVVAGEVEDALGSREGAAALFRATFTYQNTADRPRRMGDVRVRTIPRGHRRCYSEVSLWAREHQGYVDGALDYRTDLFRSSTMERFLMHYETLLREVARDSGIRLRDLLLAPRPADVSSVSEDEDAETLDTSTPSVTEALGVWASRDAERVVLEVDGVTLTYGDLLRRVDAEASATSMPSPPADAVSPMADEAIDKLTAALAALRTGTGCGLDHTVPPELEDQALGGALWRMAGALEADPDDVLLLPGSLCDPAVLQAALLPLMVGARIVLAGERAALDEWDLADVLEASRVTILALPTHMCARLRDTDWEGDSMLRILCLGEAPRVDVADWLATHSVGAWWVDRHRAARAWSLYGPVTGREVATGLASWFPGARWKVLDTKGRSLTPGLPGELAVGVHSAETGGGGREEDFIRTGEMVREVDGQTLHRMGRLDGRVVVEGQLIDPTETVRELKAHPGIVDAAVCPVNVGAGDRRLAGYVVWQEGAERATTTELRQLIRNRLSPAHVPGALVFVDDIPRRADGAVETTALPSPFRDTSPTAPDFVGPRTTDEGLVAEVWQELLRVDRISVTDNFFQLGGDSLMLLKAVGLIEDRSGHRLDPRVLFFHSLERVAQALGDPRDAPSEGHAT